MYRTILSSFFCIFLYTLTAQETFSLEQAKAYGIANHPSIQLADIDIAEANANIKETRAMGLPKLKAGVDYQFFAQKPKTPFSFGFAQDVAFIEDSEGEERLVSYILTDDQDRPVPAPDQLLAFVRNNNLVANLELSSLVFDVSYIHALKASKTYKQYFKLNKDKTEQDVKENIQQAFIDVLFVQSNVETVDKNIVNLKKTVFEVEQSYINGFVEKLDVDRLKLSLQNLENERQNLLRNIEQAKLLLKYQMNYPLDQPIELQGDLQSQAEQLMALGIPDTLSYENRVENDIFNVTNQLNDLNVKTVEASFYPNLVAFAQHQQQIQRDELFNGNEAGFVPSTIVGLTLSATIFDGWGRQARLEKALLEKERNIKREDEFHRGVELQIEIAVKRLQNAMLAAELEKKSLDMTADIFEIAQIKYREGVGSSVELQQAERDLYTAQAQYNQKLYEVFNNSAELDKALGNL